MTLELCPTCGAADYRENCRYRYEDVGCDHPALLREVEEDLGMVFGEIRHAGEKDDA